MGQVTHEQANLMLRLYEMRREPRLRQARAWFVNNFQPVPPEEFMQKYPMGSEDNASIRMVTSYWEMCANLVNRGLIDDELFFENNGEAWVVWLKLEPTAAAWRAAFKNPRVFANLEALAKRMDEWRERVAPGSTEMMRARFTAATQATAK
ncbi:MAG TPA: hypothetical protein VGA40_07425, partial [Candidatus Acidoferrales bacterium]